MQETRIEIVMDAEGKLQMTCSTENKVMALGMLDFARFLLMSQKPSSNPGILLATPGIPGMANGHR